MFIDRFFDPVYSSGEKSAVMLPNIQLLRAVAVYMVLFVHLKQLLPETSLTSLLHDKGYSGVDLFFVISGFIMVYTTSRSRVSAGEFLFHRARRILPLYYLVTLFVFAIAITFPFVLQHTTTDLHALLKSLAFVPFEKAPGRIYPLYYLGWTLNYEIFFYLVFALSLSIWYEMRVALCAVILSACVLFGLWNPAPGNVILYFYSQPILLDFLLGMIIALFRDQIVFAMGRIWVLPWLALLTGVAGLATASSFLPVSPSLHAPPTNTFLTFGVPMGLIVIAAVGFADVRTRGRPWQFLQEIGNASYSIYLTHFFVVGALIALAHRIALPPTSQIALAAAALPLTAMVGIAVYRGFERPVLSTLARWGRGHEWSRRAVPPRIHGSPRLK
jgi:peptidoglycan/LPS O-acetylase OafA/YrhL